jgi:hypothetical protein
MPEESHTQQTFGERSKTAHFFHIDEGWSEQTLSVKR